MIRTLSNTIKQDRVRFKIPRMVQDINEQEVSPKERLGNRVLHYRADLKELQVAADMDREREGREAR